MTEHHHPRSHRFRELAFRESDGVSVRLLWDSLADEVFVRVRDHSGGDFVLKPPKDRALDAFNHPYASLFRLDEQRAAASSVRLRPGVESTTRSHEESS
jgi:hypothetical protein